MSPHGASAQESYGPGPIGARPTATPRASAERPHARLRRFDARLILSWIGKNLEGRTDPRAHGKGLTANRSGEWRYRIGSYRALCVIEDDRLIIEAFSVGHRRNTHS